eukprot:5220848-Prymnesium_polylepis.2
MGPRTPLEVGDTVAIPVLAWGRGWAEANYPETWRSALFMGTVVEKMAGGKLKCDFEEEDPADRGCFLRQALKLVSRPGGIKPPTEDEKCKHAPTKRSHEATSAAAVEDSGDEEGVHNAQGRKDELTAAMAVAQARAEGLVLERADTASGFKNVALQRLKFGSSYTVQVRSGEQKGYLGTFKTAEEAALVYARHIARTSSPCPPTDESGKRRKISSVAAAGGEERSERQTLTGAEEAKAQARAEGLVLVPANSSSGFEGVQCHPGGFEAHGSDDRGKEVNLGTFSTAEAAALVYARHSGPKVVAAAVAGAVAGEP